MWLKRYKQRSIEGLKNLSGRGRKPILAEADLEKVKAVIAEPGHHRRWPAADGNLNQQRAVARAELEHALGKSFSADTLKRFVKKRLLL